MVTSNKLRRHSIRKADRTKATRSAARLCRPILCSKGPLPRCMLHRNMNDGCHPPRGRSPELLSAPDRDAFATLTLKGIPMKPMCRGELLEATRLTEAGRLSEATATIQRLLSGKRSMEDQKYAASPRTATMDGAAEEVTTDAFAPHTEQIPNPQAMQRLGGTPIGTGAPSLREKISGLLGRVLPGGVQRLAPPPGWQESTGTPGPSPGGTRFLLKEFANEAGSRPYKLYIPAGYHGGPVPLIVMLHGCSQSPDDFAAGTRMNAAADEHNCIVAWPAQTRGANLQKCWNWFKAGEQLRDRGEPSLIAGITRQVMRDYAVDPGRVYVAGLSAGGAAAAVMGHVYSDLYAAIGVHSGLPCGAARDASSAMTAMRRGAAGIERSMVIVPTIVFHGHRDTTVNPVNADAVVAQAAGASATIQRTEVSETAGGHGYTRTVFLNASGQSVVEQWKIHGAGHAWSGGDLSGSFTDTRGPDATREMLRFFLEHARPVVWPTISQ
jgi:poly(hydroxyalkanoate) depolymerase family esterase